MNDYNVPCNPWLSFFAKRVHFVYSFQQPISVLEHIIDETILEVIVDWCRSRLTSWAARPLIIYHLLNIDVRLLNAAQCWTIQVIKAFPSLQHTAISCFRRSVDWKPPKLQTKVNIYADFRPSIGRQRNNLFRPKSNCSPIYYKQGNAADQDEGAPTLGETKRIGVEKTCQQGTSVTPLDIYA